MKNPPTAPISYQRRRRVESYSYLRKVKGRVRRKRITVKRYYRTEFVVKFPGEVAVRAPAPVKLAPIEWRKIPKPRKPRKPPSKWIDVDGYIDMLDEEASRERAEYETATWQVKDGERVKGSRKVIETRDLILRTKDKPGVDRIHTGEKFLWKSKIRSFDMKGLGLRKITIIRVWAKAYDSSRKKYVIFSRTRSFGRPASEVGEDHPITSYERAKEWALDIYGSIVDSMDHADYMEVQEMVAWTVYGI